jgi:plasmid stability protein
MASHLQIRNVPDDLHRRLKARAAARGQSLSEYLLEEVERLAALPTLEELRERIAARDPVEIAVDPVDVIRAQRDAS